MNSCSIFKQININMHLQILSSGPGITQGGILRHHSKSKSYAVKPNISLTSHHNKIQAKVAKQTHP